MAGAMSGKALVLPTIFEGFGLVIVEAMAAGADLGERRVVGIVVGDRDLDVEFLLELLDEFRAGIVTPVVDVELARRRGGAGKGQHANGRHRRRGHPFHFHSLFLSVVVTVFFY